MSPGRGEIPQASPVSPVSSVCYEGYTARLALLGLGGCWGVWECTRSRLVMDMGTMCQWMWGQYATPTPQDGRRPPGWETPRLLQSLENAGTDPTGADWAGGGMILVCCLFLVQTGKWRQCWSSSSPGCSEPVQGHCELFCNEQQLRE